MLAFKGMQLHESLFHQATFSSHSFYFPMRKTVRGETMLASSGKMPVLEVSAYCWRVTENKMSSGH